MQRRTRMILLLVGLILVFQTVMFIAAGKPITLSFAGIGNAGAQDDTGAVTALQTFLDAWVKGDTAVLGEQLGLTDSGGGNTDKSLTQILGRYRLYSYHVDGEISDLSAGSRDGSRTFSCRILIRTRYGYAAYRILPCLLKSLGKWIIDTESLEQWTPLRLEEYEQESGAVHEAA